MLLSLSLSLLLGLWAGPAAAQTTHRSAGRQDADQRRAQREARRLPSPYADSHLQPGRRLRRGEGNQPRPEGSDLVRFENGNRPRAVKRSPLAGRRKH
ncbi:hypothetical protein [uncultured Hymenobacter sp.]|uniref:hypothetical protein n=1 Tax=uncultured Hymenobacter sp. TaxID=170016 RepID=UPI0035CA0AAB